MSGTCPEHIIPISYYTHSLANYVRNSQAMTMVPRNSLKFGSIQRNDYKIL